MAILHTIDLWQQLEVFLDAAIAAILGSIIGWERDRAGKSAGPRTMALVACASASVVAIGSVLDINARYGDPTRAMHAIITGIGFLGAGLIFTNHKGGSNCFRNGSNGLCCGLGISTRVSRNYFHHPCYFAIKPVFGNCIKQAR